MKVKIYNKYGIIKDEYDGHYDFSVSLHNVEKIFLKHYIIVSYNLEKSKGKYKQVLCLRSKYNFNTAIIDNKVIIEITK